MNWKTEATEKLRRYDAMHQAVLNLPEQIAWLEADACRIRSANFDKTPVKGGGNKREEALLGNMVHRQELHWALEQAQSWIKTVDRALGVLTPEERLVLSRLLVYPERGSLERLCADLGVEQSSIYRKRDKALQRFAVALYGSAGE